MSQNATPPPQPPASPASPGVAPPAGPPPVPPALIQQVQSIRRILLLSGLAFLVLLVLGGLWGYLWHRGYYFYSTDDATVAGTVANVAPLETGTITTVYRGPGSSIHKGDIIAVLRTTNGSTENVTSPIDGTIIQEGATPGEVLQGGQTLAQVVNLRTVFITAYVQETHIKDVHPGQGVDVKVDAVSGLTFHGTVTRILAATASTGAALPTTDYASGNFTKVTQRVPVQITLDGFEGQTLLPGTSTSVTIHLRQ